MSENRIERPEPGSEFTSMTATGEPMGGLMHVRGVTVTEDGGDEWTGYVVLPNNKEETGD
ncbi:hypothetical protein [Phycicoccus ginsengisoli]